VRLRDLLGPSRGGRRVLRLWCKETGRPSGCGARPAIRGLPASGGRGGAADARGVRYVLGSLPQAQEIWVKTLSGCYFRPATMARLASLSHPGGVAVDFNLCFLGRL
jgi:hypothetical protein